MRRPLAFVLCAVLALSLSPPASATQSVDADPARATLERYAADTWRSFVAMTDPDSGLPADRLHIDGTVSVQT